VEVEQVIHDLDEGQIVCLFTVGQPFAASFWQNAAKVEPAQVGLLLADHDPLAVRTLAAAAFGLFADLVEHLKPKAGA